MRSPAPRGLREDWSALSGTARPNSETFDDRMVADLPHAARAWLTHAIAPGTPLARTVALEMKGHIKIGAWRPFVARQILAPPDGFIWAATARVAGLPVVGFDRYTRGSGQMHWRLAGLIPVMSGAGADIARSAAGRLAAEATVLLPTAFRHATWEAGETDAAATATWAIDNEVCRVRVAFDSDHRLAIMTMQRWGNPGGEPFGYHPFGVAVDREQSIDGITIPAVFRAGWWWASDREREGEFFRARITSATFR